MNDWSIKEVRMLSFELYHSLQNSTVREWEALTFEALTKAYKFGERQAGIDIQKKLKRIRKSRKK